MITFKNVFIIGAVFIIIKGLLIGIGVDLPDRLGYKVDNTHYYALKSVAFGIIIIIIAWKLFPETPKE